MQNCEKNRILINAAQGEEIRVAVLDERNKLLDLDIEYSGYEQKKSNIYKGKISRIEPSLEAAFIDYGAERHGFLPFKEIAPTYTNGHDLSTIKSNLRVGQEIMVQIEKEERGNKGAALTTYITLPGSYLVLMPNNSGAGGISRRIEGEERRATQELLNQLSYPADVGLILRTACVGRDLSELQGDLNLLLTQWDAIQKAFTLRPAPFLIFQEGDLLTRSIRDYLRRDIDQIIIDDKKIYEKTKQYIEQVRPDFVSRITLYQSATPLFHHFNIEEAAESAFQNEIRLPSGGTIVIDRTEALVAIDINSGRSTKNGDIEETAIKTNLEAAKEIAHQLRIRDLGGLIVIDFIDMSSEDNKRKVENCLREASKKDRARIQLGRISAFGLLEMSRQRLRHSLGKANETLCTHCNGQGTVRSIRSLALSLLRLVEKEALKKSVQQIQLELPIQLATYLINEKRSVLNKIEQTFKVTLLIIPNPYWQSPQYKLTTLSKNGKSDDQGDSGSESYQLIEDRSKIDISQPYIQETKQITEVPAVKSLNLPNKPNKAKSRLGLLNRLFSLLSNRNKDKKNPSAEEQTKQKKDIPQKEQASEKRYGKNSKNRTRSRRERGQQKRYPAHLTPRYEPSHAAKSINKEGGEDKFSRKKKSVPAKPLKTDGINPEERNQKKAKERAITLPANKPQHDFAKQPSPTSAVIIEKQIIKAVEKDKREETTLTQDTKTLRPTSSSTENPTKKTSSRALQRKNMRRFGGEPKKKHRNYACSLEKNG